MALTNMKSSFRQKKMQVSREIGLQLALVGVRFSSTYSRLCGCLIVAWRQHQMQLSRVGGRHCKKVSLSVLLDFGSSCPPAVAGQGRTSRMLNPSMQGPIPAHTILPPSWHTTASTKSIQSFVSQKMIDQVIVTDFGRYVEWLRLGRKICVNFLSPRGLCVLMNPCAEPWLSKTMPGFLESGHSCMLMMIIAWCKP